MQGMANLRQGGHWCSWSHSCFFGKTAEFLWDQMMGWPVEPVCSWELYGYPEGINITSHSQHICLRQESRGEAAQRMGVGGFKHHLWQNWESGLNCREIQSLWMSWFCFLSWNCGDLFLKKWEAALCWGQGLVVHQMPLEQWEDQPKSGYRGELWPLGDAEEQLPHFLTN